MLPDFAGWLPFFACAGLAPGAGLPDFDDASVPGLAVLDDELAGVKVDPGLLALAFARGELLVLAANDAPVFACSSMVEGSGVAVWGSGFGN